MIDVSFWLPHWPVTIHLRFKLR